MGQNNSSNPNSSMSISKQGVISNSSSGGPYFNAEYEGNVRHFLEVKRRDFEERYKNNGYSTKIVPSFSAGLGLPAPGTRSAVKLDDFELDRTIGTGSFGRVMVNISVRPT